MALLQFACKLKKCHKEKRRKRRKSVHIRRREGRGGKRVKLKIVQTLFITAAAPVQTLPMLHKKLFLKMVSVSELVLLL